MTGQNETRKTRVRGQRLQEIGNPETGTRADMETAIIIHTRGIGMDSHPTPG